MNNVNFNGSLLKAGTPVIETGNRGLRYGDGLFETIKFRNNEFQLLNYHLDRLWHGMSIMRFELPKLFTKDFIAKEILKTVDSNKYTHARVRLTIVRNNGGLYDAVDNKPVFIIECWQLEESFGQLNENGLHIGIYKDALKSCDQFSNIKHNNFLPYLMGALHAKTNRLNDALLLNQYGRICDSSIANIFCVEKEKIYTPPLQEGCIAGTIRKLLIDYLPAAGFKVIEKPITEEYLMDADEVFLTNTMTPLKWVASLETKTYTNGFSVKIHQAMAKTFPRIFC